MDRRRVVLPDPLAPGQPDEFGGMDLADRYRSSTVSAPYPRRRLPCNSMNRTFAGVSPAVTDEPLWKGG